MSVALGGMVPQYSPAKMSAGLCISLLFHLPAHSLWRIELASVRTTAVGCKASQPRSLCFVWCRSSFQPRHTTAAGGSQTWDMGPGTSLQDSSKRPLEQVAQHSTDRQTQLPGTTENVARTARCTAHKQSKASRWATIMYLGMAARRDPASG